MGTFIFISHRHEDKPIADVITQHLQLWGISSTDIFQSSSATRNIRVTSTIGEELKQALTKANLLILVYTHSMYDWSYCMWECGVAMDPTIEDTKFIVFECSGDPANTFQTNVRLRVTREDIEKFTYQFHREPNFFPKQQAFQPSISDVILKKKAEQFYNELLGVIPTGTYSEIPLLHMIKFSLAPEFIFEIQKTRKPNEAYECIRDNLLIKEASPYCPHHFGFSTFKVNMKWSWVVERWRNEVEKRQALDDSWVEDLYSEIWRAINNKPAIGTSNAFSSIMSADQHYIPLLCLMRSYPDNAVEFNVYLYLKKD